jgi:hypothetical protein
LGDGVKVVGGGGSGSGRYDERREEELNAMGK